MSYLNYGGSVGKNSQIKRKLVLKAVEMAENIKVDFLEIRENARKE